MIGQQDAQRAQDSSFCFAWPQTDMEECLKSPCDPKRLRYGLLGPMDTGIDSGEGDISADKSGIHQRSQKVKFFLVDSSKGR